jgi:signal peptidase I
LPASESTEAPEDNSPHRRLARSTLEWVGVVVVALLAALLVKTYVLQTFWIPSASMEHTLDEGDRVFVNKLAYDFHPVHRGDIIVFTPTPYERTIIGPGINDLIKRVIGLPGDTIQGMNGHIYIDGRPLAEPYLSPGVSPTAGRPVPKQVIPPGHYFLMGDNRGDSTDSRYFGTITEAQIVGRAFVRIWPLSRLGFL